MTVQSSDPNTAPEATHWKYIKTGKIHDPALCHGNGGVLSRQVTAVLGTQATL